MFDQGMMVQPGDRLGQLYSISLQVLGYGICA
jgi:hypothetical protein